MPRRTRCVLLVFAAFTWMPAAQAGLITYADRATFEAATTGRTAIDFADGLAPGQTLREIPGVAGYTAAGVNFRGTPSNFLYIIAAAHDSTYGGWDGDPTVLQSLVRDTLTVFLPTGVTAVGTDLYTIETATAPPATYGGPVVVTLASGETFTVDTFDKPTVAFVGFTSTAPITSLTFRANDSSYLNVANFTYGTAAAVPEPSTLVMAGGGVVGLAVGRRRKRKAVRSAAA